MCVARGIPGNVSVPLEPRHLAFGEFPYLGLKPGAHFVVGDFALKVPREKAVFEPKLFHALVRKSSGMEAARLVEHARLEARLEAGMDVFPQFISRKRDAEPENVVESPASFFRDCPEFFGYFDGAYEADFVVLVYLGEALRVEFF